MSNAFVPWIKLYRKVVPRRVRDLVGALRTRRKPWSEAQAAVGSWSFQDYSKPRWEREYRTDKWSYMRGLEELSRYSVVIGYARYLHPHGAILDLGCGEGILQEHFGPQNYARYVGVDLCQAAIDAARAREDEKTRFICADVATFTPDRTFDVIVFNEVLYYLADPVPVMRRYERFLRPNGAFIVSMFANDETRKNWATLEGAYHFIDETRTGNAKSGFGWSCRVARPAPTQTTGATL